MGEILPNGIIQGYYKRCDRCGRDILVNIQGDDVDGHCCGTAGGGVMPVRKSKVKVINPSHSHYGEIGETVVNGKGGVDLYSNPLAPNDKTRVVFFVLFSSGEALPMEFTDVRKFTDTPEEVE